MVHKLDESIESDVSNISRINMEGSSGKEEIQNHGKGALDLGGFFD